MSATKSLAVGSTLKLVQGVGLTCRTQALKAARSTKLLGVGSAGGRRRSTAVQKDRIKSFRERVPRIQRLRRDGVSAVRLTRAAGTPVMIMVKWCD